MQKTKGLVKYHLQQYFKTNKFVMPFAVFLIMLCSHYSVKPLAIIDCLLASSMMVFLIMVWIGGTVCDLENEVSEQILILRVQSKKKYYFSQVLFLLILSLIISLIGIIFPVIQNVINGNQLFERSIVVSDLAGGFVILFLSAFVGGALGELSHPRIFKDRKIGIIFIFLLAVLTLAKGAMIKQTPWMKLILWILPPIWDVSCLFADREYFYFSGVVTAGGILLFVGTLFTIVKIQILRKRGF